MEFGVERLDTDAASSGVRLRGSNGHTLCIMGQWSPWEEGQENKQKNKGGKKSKSKRKRGRIVYLIILYMNLKIVQQAHRGWREGFRRL